MSAFTGEKPYHGGNLEEATTLFGEPSAGWLDLSTGINPFAYPDTALAAASFVRLPQFSNIDRLIAAARAYYNVPSGCAIAALPGTQAALQWLPWMRAADDVSVIGPTYGEHAFGWEQARHAVRIVNSISETKRGGVIVLVNPNNPDGRRIEPAALIDAAHALAERDGLLVVDEAFADVVPDLSLIPLINGELPVVVLRSFGKFFGLPGLRLGFAAGSKTVVDQLIGRLGPWAVPGPAIEIGTRALCDKAWVDGMRHRLVHARVAFDRVLESAGLEVRGGTDLFRLVRHRQAERIFSLLGRAGIFVRRFPDHSELLRFGLPGPHADLERVAKALNAAPIK